MHSSHLIQVLITSNHQLYPLDTTQSCFYNIEMPPAQHYSGYSYSYFRSQFILFSATPPPPESITNVPYQAVFWASYFTMTTLIFLYDFWRWEWGGSVVMNLPAYAGNKRDVSWIPGSGRSPGDRNGNPLQYSCLENSMHRGIRLSSGLLILQWNSDFFL